MKYLIYALTVCLLLTACEKYESGQSNPDHSAKRLLNESEKILRNNLDQAAKILTEIIQDDAVMNELKLLSDESRTFYNLSFRDLIDESKGPGASFQNLRQKFLARSSTSGSKGGNSDLTDYLAVNDCYIYCPYPSDFYPKKTNTFTLAGHPIDNDIENTGYRFEGKKIIEVKVNEEYADKYPVILIMPRNEDNYDLSGLAIESAELTKGDPIYEVKIGKIRCAQYCGGIFEGTLELRVTRGYPDYNTTSEEIKASFSTVIPINYPRDYAKAAINNWTVHSNGGWFLSDNIWDSNWRTSKVQQCIMVYEYDQVNEVSISATVGYKPDELTSALTATVKTTYRGDFLGIVEWDRDWFFATNSTYRPGEEMKDGWVVRRTCPVLKLTTPLRTITY